MTATKMTSLRERIAGVAGAAPSRSEQGLTQLEGRLRAATGEGDD